MGTLSLVLGIIFLLIGIFGSPLWMMFFSFPYAFVPAIVLIAIGVFLIKKYDKDKKKEKNS